MVSLKKYYVFREADKREELEALLNLRFRGYLQSRCASLLDEDIQELDLDAYDLRAIHLGLFEYGGRKPKPVGYLRIILDRISDKAPVIRKIAAKHPGLTAKLEQKTKAVFPLMAQCDENGGISQFYQKARAQGKTVAELSRFVFDPAIRSMGFTRFFTESAIIASLFTYGVDYNILACTVRHSSYYQRFGFKAVEEGVCYAYGQFDASVLMCSAAAIPEKLKAKAINMQKTYELTGGLSYFPIERGKTVTSVQKARVAAVRNYRQAV